MDWKLIALVLLGLAVWWFFARLTALLLESADPGDADPGDTLTNGGLAVFWPLTWSVLFVAVLLGWMVKRLPPLRWLATHLANFGASTNARMRAQKLLQRARLKP